MKTSNMADVPCGQSATASIYPDNSLLSLLSAPYDPLNLARPRAFTARNLQDIIQDILSEIEDDFSGNSDNGCEEELMGEEYGFERQ